MYIYIPACLCCREALLNSVFLASFEALTAVTLMITVL
jgi:hypothetical protein